MATKVTTMSVIAVPTPAPVTTHIIMRPHFLSVVVGIGLTHDSRDAIPCSPSGDHSGCWHPLK
jgi:hypothetical protein